MKFYKKIILIALISLSLISFPLKAEAVFFIPIILGLSALGAGAAIFNWVAPTAISNTVAAGIIAIIDTVVNGFFGLATVLFVNVFKAVLSLQNALLKIDAVREVWTIFRDFANMFFILLLVITAFATIFNMPQGYRYKELLPKIIIAALLINFSFVIFQWAVDLMWLPSNLFIGAIAGGKFDPNAIGESLGRIFQLNEIKELTFGAAREPDIQGAALIFTLFKGVFYVAIAFALGWIALVLLVRIPILMGLAMISPIVWISFAFPAIRNVWSTWWNQVIKWGLIPFFYLAVIYFVLLFNQRIGEFLLGQVTFSGEATAFWPLAFNTTILLFINLGLLFYGLYWAHQFAEKSGAYGYNLINAVPYVGQIPGAIGRTVGRIQKEGLPGKGGIIYGGEAAREAQRAKLEDILGKRIGLRPTYEAEKNFLNKTEEAAKDIDNQFKRISTKEEEKKLIADLRTRVEKGAKDPGTLAAITTLAKRGQLDAGLFNEAVKQFEKIPLAMTKVFSEWKEGKFGGISVPEFLKIAKDDRVPLEARKIAYSFLATEDAKKVAEEMTYEDYEKGYQILGRRNTKEGRDFKKNIGKLKPTIAARYNLKNIKEEVDKAEDRAKILAMSEKDRLSSMILEQIKGAGAKDMADYAKGEWDPVKNENFEDFKKAVDEMIRNKKEYSRQYVSELRRRFVREGKDKQLEVLNKLGYTTTGKTTSSDEEEEEEEESKKKT